MTRRERTFRFAQRLQRIVAFQIARHVARGEDAHGRPLRRLWADEAVFPGGLKSDRAGGIPLYDSGRLLRSIRPGVIRLVGRTYVCPIMGADYALKQHRGFSQHGDRIVGRTLAARRAVRASGGLGLREGDWLNLRGDPKVPARPFIGLSRASAERAIRFASRALNG